MADDWRTPDVEALFDAILRLEDTEEAERFFRDLCTLSELHDMAQRWAVVRLLDAGLHYAEISRTTGASTATITRIASWLNHGEGGYRGMLDKLDAAARRHEPLPHRGRAMRDRLRLAVPNKGRLVEPTLRLLHDAGLVFEEHDRSLVARVQNFDLDILFVRTNDIIEFVGDGVADLGITGDRPADRDRRRAAADPRPRLRPLPAGGRGPERLALSRPSRTWRASASRRPTRTPPAGSSRSKGIAVDIIPISGAVEVAPRLGLAEAIVDLVSTGSTLVMNGLRQIGDVLASEAVLVANPTADRERAARDRRDRHDAQRGHRRARPQVPDDERAGEPPGRDRGPAARPGIATVIPLAHAGMIAIHSVVGADEVWGLLPRLKAAGASGILVLPIEKIVP